MTRAVLLLGGSGQLGTALQRRAWPADVALVAPGRTEADLCDTATLAALVASRPWAAIILVAAYTAVDQAESDVEAAWRVNALAPAVVAAAAAKAGIPLVHLSTDYVFDGRLARPYREDDPVAPLGVYGASKEAGEQAVRTAQPRSVILRTAWVVSPTGRNFLKTMLRLAAERPILRVVDDQRGCPTSAADLAAAVQAIALRLAEDPNAPTGTIHAVNAGAITWCGLARHIVAESARRGGLSPAVEAIATADFPTPARRPANSRLDTTRLRDTYGITLRPWQEAVAEIVAELAI